MEITSTQIEPISTPQPNALWTKKGLSVDAKVLWALFNSMPEAKRNPHQAALVLKKRNDEVYKLMSCLSKLNMLSIKNEHGKRPEVDLLPPEVWTEPKPPQTGKASVKRDHGINFNFEAIYQAYPRKEGKSDGMKKLKKIIKSQADYEQFLSAVVTYKRKKAGEDKQFLLLFSTFCSGRWEDYLPENQPAKPKPIDWWPK